MQYSQVVGRLQHALAAELPGAAAHQLMAPRPRRAWPPGSDPSAPRDAAGLLVVYAANALAHVVLTVRAGTLGRHGGQVSLPGGVVDPGETFAQTALREAYEEIALPASAVRVLGPLTPLDIPVSGFRLHPVVAIGERLPALRPADGEVAAILEVPVAELLDPARLVASVRDRDGQRVVAPAFRVADYDIWGATAMVLAEFLVLLGWSPGSRSGAPEGDVP